MLTTNGILIIIFLQLINLPYCPVVGVSISGLQFRTPPIIPSLPVALLEEELKSSNKKIMANYFSGEEIKVGDFITTDNGHDKNKVIKLIDNTYLMQSYGLDCFGVII